ncbi:hypothetical protein [Actinoplanes sp. GCM10030250]|uniref:hypothetical protein n=1 Tax=Actinoplanes sp. GCM10030250 TaxID=3273376 RepID=UPI0036071D69
MSISLKAPLRRSPRKASSGVLHSTTPAPPGRRRTRGATGSAPRRTGAVLVVLLLAAAGLGGCGVSDDIDKAINEIDKTRSTVESISSSWRDELPKLAAELKGLENQVAADAKTVVSDATNQVQDVANQAIQLSDAKAQDLVAQAGVEFRCNAGFVKSGVVSQLQHLVDDLKFWKKTKSHLNAKPIHSVCWINPTVLSLYPNGDGWLIDSSNMSDKNVVRLFGYNFRPDALPVLELQNAAGQNIRNANLKSAYVTRYQVNLDFSSEDFKGAQAGSRLVFRWPDQEDPNTVNLILNRPAALRIAGPTFTPPAPTATKDSVILKVAVKNEGGTRSGTFQVYWKPDPIDPRILSVTRAPLNPGESADVSFPGFVYTRGGTISSTVSLSNGDDAKNVPLVVADPPAVPAPERDLPGFPQIPSTTYGKYIGGYGLDTQYGGDCSPGYVHTTAQVVVIDTRGPATATYLGWSDPANPSDCRISVHYSVAASFPNPSPNYVQVRIIINERGA